MIVSDKIMIAIDGPASSGKSTISKQIAKDLQLIHIDTGAMYRSLTLAAIHHQIDMADQQALVELLQQIEIDFKQETEGQAVLINGQEVSQAIRSTEVSRQVSQLSAHPAVRKELVRRQRSMAENQGVVMDGRDIGTVVLPDADFKFFLDASVEERARRRFLENQARGISGDYDQIRADILLRDQKDRQREVAPLKAAADAIILDTTQLSIQEVVDRIKALIAEN